MFHLSSLWLWKKGEESSDKFKLMTKLAFTSFCNGQEPLINDESWFFRNSRAVSRPKGRIIGTTNGVVFLWSKLNLAYDQLYLLINRLIIQTDWKCKDNIFSCCSTVVVLGWHRNCSLELSWYWKYSAVCHSFSLLPLLWQSWPFQPFTFSPQGVE